MTMIDKGDFIQPNIDEGSSNNLFPVFLKLHHLKTVIIGGGYVGMEKLVAILSNCPNASVKLVATTISDEIKQLVVNYPFTTLIEKMYEADDLNDADIVIAAVNDKIISRQVSADAKAKKILINAADKPSWCDFYLGSIVQKGNLKIAISTNGTSPTIAKRVKEVLQDTIPDEIDDLLKNMQKVRNKLSGDFAEKVRQLNDLTRSIVINNLHGNEEF